MLPQGYGDDAFEITPTGWTPTAMSRIKEAYHAAWGSRRGRAMMKAPIIPTQPRAKGDRMPAES